MVVISTSTRGGHPGKKKHGTKSTGHTSTNHHHHENKSIRVEERALRTVRKEIYSVEKPLPLIDIGIDRISELIKSITRDNEDAFQQSWAKVLDDHCQKEEDILNYARQSIKETYVHYYPERSLQKPLTNDGDNSFSIEDTIVSPELVFDAPEMKEGKKRGNGKSYLYKQGIDEDVVQLLQNKYPGESIRHALRMVLDLPTKDTKHWKQAELAILRSKYPIVNVEAIAIELSRSASAIRQKASDLDIKRTMRSRITPEHSFNTEDVTRLFQFSKRQLQHVISQGYLVWERYKHLKIFHRNDIISFIRNHPFEYRHELLTAEWYSYVPPNIQSWLTIEQIAKKVNWGSHKIRRMIKREELPVKYYCSHKKAVAYLRVENASNVLESELEPQPYQTAIKGEKKHYVYWTGDNVLVNACNPEIKGLPYEALKKYNYNPFVKGYPTCLNCLNILRKFRTTKCK